MLMEMIGTCIKKTDRSKTPESGDRIVVRELNWMLIQKEYEFSSVGETLFNRGMLFMDVCDM